GGGGWLDHAARVRIARRGWAPSRRLKVRIRRGGNGTRPPPVPGGRPRPRLCVALFDAIARVFETLLEGVDLRAPRGFERQLDLGLADPPARERAVVLDVQYVGALRGDEGGEPGERTGLVAQEHAQAHEPAVLDEAALDDPRDHGHVDVAAGEDQHYVEAREPERAVEKRGQRCGARALDDRLRHLGWKQDRV